MKRMRYVLFWLVMVSTAPFARAAAPLQPGHDSTAVWPESFQRRMMAMEHNIAAVKIEPPDTSFIIADIVSRSSVKMISVIAVGDIMPGTNYPKASYLPPDVTALFSPVKDLIQSADIATGNLEGVFSSRGGIPKTCRDTTNCYVFRMPDDYIWEIKNAGFDILGTANNHVNDFGQDGRENTAGILRAAGMHFAGLIDFPFTIMDTLGMKVAYCAFSPHTGTVNMLDYAGAARLVARLKKTCDIVIVGFHGGAEGKDHQHVTREDEEFLGNDRGNVYRFAHTVVDAGADLVIGSGPHVVRAVELYKGRLIAYSLGNFCTFSRFNLSGPNALAPVLQVWMDSSGRIVKARVHAFYQPGDGGPVPDPDLRAVKKIRELTNMDFPEEHFHIDDEGWITIPEEITAQKIPSHPDQGNH